MLALLFAWAVCLQAFAKPPVLYERERPVGGEPDDLVLLAGSGLSADDVLEYQSAEARGAVPIVSTAGIPGSLVIRQSGVPMLLRVRNAQGEWSNAVRINDARPQWFTPADFRAGVLPRVVKVVGRNLQRSSIKLSGPRTFTLKTLTADRFTVESELPEALPAGEYEVQVSDGASWIPVAGQRLIVKPDSKPLPQFDLAPCKADDDADDSACLLEAVRSAQTKGGGEVVLGPGVWRLIGDVSNPDGIVLPQGVSLRGAGAGRTRLVRHATWSKSPATATLTLLGGNTVQGITFEDQRSFQPTDAAGPMIRLGKMFYRVGSDEPKGVDDVVIVRNVFDKSFMAISDGGLPIRRLIIAYNEMNAYRTSIALSGNRYNTAMLFTLEDSVIAWNTFTPGSYIDAGTAQGAMASTLGASHRLDFSHNTANGATGGGWRAAFFWHLAGNHEQLLVSLNTATCTGDKIGDGEAIAYDGNVNTYAFDAARTVLSATQDTVTVQGPLRARQHDRDVPLATYYIGHWVTIVEGAGLGQARKIMSYVVDSATGRITFKVSAEWGVVPDAQQSRVSVSRQYWQVYTVGNVIDHRQPLCRKSNRSQPRGGGIVLWAPMSEAAVADNRQFDTDGIILQQAYSAVDRECPSCRSYIASQYFADIQYNTIDGEYDWSSNCSHSGIQAGFGASPTPSSPPPVVSYGLSIAHNSIRRADGLKGGGISFPLTWHRGPPPHRWPLVQSPLIQHNSLRDIAGSTPAGKCERLRRRDIHLEPGGLIQGAVLYENTLTER